MYIFIEKKTVATTSESLVIVNLGEIFPKLSENLRIQSNKKEGQCFKWQKKTFVEGFTLYFANKKLLIEARLTNTNQYLLNLYQPFTGHRIP